MTGITTVVGNVNGAIKQIVVASDANGNLSPGHVLVDQNCSPFGTAGNPIFTEDAAGEASLASLVTVAGTTADSAYAGSGSSSVIAALKGVYAAIKGTLTVSWSGQSVALSAGSSVIGAVTMAGDVGTDRSINAPSGPGSATTLTYNGNTLTQLVSIASNTSRKSLEVNNTTGALVVLVFDDGANTAGTVSLLPLAAGTAQYQQGGDFQSQTEQGRVRIFGTTGTFCYAREN
jgi:hypothetical protein